MKTAKENKLTNKWLAAVDRRRADFPQMSEESESLRLLHSETGDLRVDKVGPHLVGGWWKDQKPTEFEKQSVRCFFEKLGHQSWCYYWRPSKGTSVDVALVDESQPAPPESWVFEEAGVQYQARREQGHSYGLFLDQRHNRRWLKQNSKGLRVLNLFCFTGGFSVCAALGGAQQVVSVDLSRKYLDWTEENFALNNCSPSQNCYEFRAMDSFEYLKFAERKSLQFDFIICDPPSFSRHRKKVFRIDKDYQTLVEYCGNLLSPGGRLLFSSNYEKWGWEKWKESLDTAFTKHQKLASSQIRYGEVDFEDQPKKSNLKSFLLTKA